MIPFMFVFAPSLLLADFPTVAPAAALVLIKPGWMSDLVGLVLIAATLASQRWLAPTHQPETEKT